MKHASKKRVISTLSATLLVSSMMPWQAMAATDLGTVGAQFSQLSLVAPQGVLPAKMVPNFPVPTVTNGYQTITVPLKDASGNLVDTSDHVALSLYTLPKGFLTVLQADGTPVDADANGRFIVTADHGVATFKVLDTKAEELTYRLSDLDNSVPNVLRTGRFADVSSYQFTPTQTISADGSIGGGDTRTVKVKAVDNRNVPLGGADLYLALNPTEKNQKVGGGSAKVGTTDLTVNPKHFTTPSDGIGQISITYQTPLALPITGGTDKIVVQNTEYYPTKTASVSYSYNQLSKYSFLSTATSTTIANNGSLGTNAVKTFKVKGVTSSGLPFGKTTIFLSIKSIGGSAKVGTTDLTETPQAFPTDADGTITVTYTTASSSPNGGQDQIIAQDQQVDPTMTSTVSYTYANISRFAFYPSTNIRAGKVPAGTTDQMTVNVYGSTGKLMPNTTVYMKMIPTTYGGSAKVGTQSLTTDWVPVTSNAFGQVVIDYTAPAALPGGGADQFLVQDVTTNPHAKGTYSYTFSSITNFRFVGTPVPSTPIAATGTLVPDQQQTTTLIADGMGGLPMPNTYVYLSVPATNEGAFAVAGDLDHPLDTSLRAVKTDGQGHVDLIYTAPHYLPGGGADTINVQEATVTPHIVRNATYTFAAISSFYPSAQAIADVGSLAPGGTPTSPLRFRAQDAKGNPITNAKVYVSLNKVSTDATATINNQPLHDGLNEAYTNAFGDVTIMYQAPSVLPVGGSDSITIQATTAANSVKKTIGYTFASVYKYDTGMIKANYLAPTGSLQAGGTVSFTYTVLDSHSQPMKNSVVYLTLKNSYPTRLPIGFVTANGTTITKDPTMVVTNDQGQVDVVYTAATPAPTTGTDYLTIQSSSSATSIGINKRLQYTY